MKKILLAIVLLTGICAFAQSKDEKEIRQLLSAQTESWNRGDLEGFMEGYWKNDSMMFIGKNGIQWGWQATLENYRKGYPDTTAMGQLTFELIQLKPLSPEYYFVVGKWKLTRTIGDFSGHYNLLLRRINGKWYIIADHSS